MATRQPNTHTLRIEQLEESQEDLDRKVKELRFFVEELERKSDGITLGNQRAAQLEEQVQALQARIDALSEHIGIPQFEAIMAEIQRIDERSDALWADLDKRQCQTDERVDKIDLRLANHNERIEANASAIAFVRSRIDSFGVPIWAYVVGAIAGVVAGVVWANHDWTETVQAGQQAISVVNSNAATWWAAVICGIAVAMVVTSILAAFTNATGNNDTQTEAGAAAAGSASVETTPPALPEEPALPPTEVHPPVSNSATATAGASSN